MALEGRLVDAKSSLKDNWRHHNPKEHFSIKTKIIMREELDDDGAQDADEDTTSGLRQPPNLEVTDQTFDHAAEGNHKDNDEESTVRKFFGIRVVAVFVEDIEDGRAARPGFDRRWVVHHGRYRRSCLGHSLGGLMSIRGGSSDGGGNSRRSPIRRIEDGGKGQVGPTVGELHGIVEHLTGNMLGGGGKLGRHDRTSMVRQWILRLGSGLPTLTIAHLLVSGDIDCSLVVVTKQLSLRGGPFVLCHELGVNFGVNISIVPLLFHPAGGGGGGRSPVVSLEARPVIFLPPMPHRRNLGPIGYVHTAFIGPFQPLLFFVFIIIVVSSDLDATIH
mmetsp:Transcript_11905/g.34056  ORF Transcript_11905/g.34056 Transcript_11905/m.34056 type:complete len:332 (-) Transcript_11905:212-1207(-)